MEHSKSYCKRHNCGDSFDRSPCAFDLVLQFSRLFSHRCPVTSQFPVAHPLNSYAHPMSCLLTSVASLTRFPGYVNLGAIFVYLGHTGAAR